MRAVRKWQRGRKQSTNSCSSIVRTKGANVAVCSGSGKSRSLVSVESDDRSWSQKAGRENGWGKWQKEPHVGPVITGKTLAGSLEERGTD